MMGSRPHSLHEILESSEVNHHHLQVPNSYQSSLFNPHQVHQDTFCFALGLNKNAKLKTHFKGNTSGRSSDILYDLNAPLEEEHQPVWQRLRWTDEMVKVLISALSYVVDDSSAISNDLQDGTNLLVTVKGKWKAISHAMVEKGYIVSPQQCEDKYNDLNKKYRRLNDLLGKGTPVHIIENPKLLESMQISDGTKQEVKKILACKQLFYQEMWSYHDNNRNNLPCDEPLQHLVRSALRGKAMYLSKKQKTQGENDINALREEQEDADQWMRSHLLGLDEKKLQIQKNMLELEERRFQWLNLCQKEDRELHMMRRENERLKLENMQLACELELRKIKGV